MYALNVICLYMIVIHAVGISCGYKNFAICWADREKKLADKSRCVTYGDIMFLNQTGLHIE